MQRAITLEGRRLRAVYDQNKGARRDPREPRYQAKVRERDPAARFTAEPQPELPDPSNIVDAVTRTMIPIVLWPSLGAIAA